MIEVTGEQARRALDLARRWKESGDAKTFDSLPAALAGFGQAINRLSDRLDGLEQKLGDIAEKTDALHEASKPVDPLSVFNAPPQAEKAEVLAERAEKIEQMQEEARKNGDPLWAFVGIC